MAEYATMHVNKNALLYIIYYIDFPENWIHLKKKNLISIMKTFEIKYFTEKHVGIFVCIKHISSEISNIPTTYFFSTVLIFREFKP